MIEMMSTRELVERIEKELVMVVENYDLNDAVVNKFCHLVADHFECYMDLPFDYIPRMHLSEISVNRNQREAIESFIVSLLNEIYDATDDEIMPTYLWIEWCYLNQLLTVDLGYTKHAIDMMSKYNELYNLFKF